MRGKDRSRRKGTSKKAETAKRQALSPNSSDKETSGNGIVDFEAILRASEQEELPRNTADSNQAVSFGDSLQLGQPQLATQQPNIVDDSGASLVKFSSTSGIQAHSHYHILLKPPCTPQPPALNPSHTCRNI